MQRTFAGVCAAVSGRNISVSLSQFVFPQSTPKLAGRIMPAGLRRGILLHTAAVQGRRCGRSCSSSLSDQWGTKTEVMPSAEVSSVSSCRISSRSKRPARKGSVKQMPPRKTAIARAKATRCADRRKADGNSVFQKSSRCTVCRALRTRSCRSWCSSRPQPKYYIFKYRHIAVKGKILKYKAEIPLLRRQVDLSFFGKTAGTVQPDLTIVRRFQSGDHPQQRRNASILDGQRFGPDDLPLIKPLRDLVQSNFHSTPLFCINDKSCRETAKSAISAMLNSRKARKSPLNNAKEMFVQTIFNTIAIQYIPLSCSCKPFANAIWGY